MEISCLRIGQGTLPCPHCFWMRIRGHLGVTTALIALEFLIIAAAPRPLRLRRGFVVTTMSLSHIMGIVVFMPMLRETNRICFSVILSVSQSLKISY